MGEMFTAMGSLATNTTSTFNDDVHVSVNLKNSATLRRWEAHKFLRIKRIEWIESRTRNKKKVSYR